MEFARDSYEIEIAPADVAVVYRHDLLTNTLVRYLNHGVDLESLAEDMDGIGYPRDRLTCSDVLADRQQRNPDAIVRIWPEAAD